MCLAATPLTAQPLPQDQECLSFTTLAEAVLIIPPEWEEQTGTVLAGCQVPLFLALVYLAPLPSPNVFPLPGMWSPCSLGESFKSWKLGHTLNPQQV